MPERASRTISTVLLAALAVGAAVLLTRIVRRHVGAAGAREVPGGLLMANVGAYDRLSHRLLGPLYRGVASDIAESASSRASILEVGCGPGHLSILLAGDHGLKVTAVDLDPEMIARAEANAEQSAAPGRRRPRFMVGDVADLPFSDASFDLVVSTFSLHHWSDPVAGLTEIARVLRPGARALIWDVRPGSRLLHAQVPDPVPEIASTPLQIVSVTPWRWPWRLQLSQRLELTRAAPSPRPRRRARKPAETAETAETAEAS